MSESDRLTRAYALLAERGPLPASTLAREIRSRYADLLRTLADNPDRFRHSGTRRDSRWEVVSVPSLDVKRAAKRWRCSQKTAFKIIFGAEGFLERGIVAARILERTITCIMSSSSS